MRLTVLAVPPVLSLIIFDLKLSGTQVGILNAIPVCLFALIAIPGSALIARVGAVPALIVGLVITAAGSFLRGFAYDSAVLYISTIVMAAGIATMQPALPPTVRQWVPNRIGFATAVYTNGLLFGEIFPVILATVILTSFDGSWRACLMLWSAPVVAVALVIFFFQPTQTTSATIVTRRSWMPDWRAPILWKIGLIMGAANQLYFCTNTFLPGHLLATQRSEWIGVALTALNVGQLPASFLLLASANHWERKAWPLMLAGVIALSGVAAVVFGESQMVVVTGAALIGFSCAAVLTITLALPALLVGPDEVPSLAAGMLAIGYGIAMISSVVGGLAWDAAGKPAFAFVPVGIALLSAVFVPLITTFTNSHDNGHSSAGK
ncbi:MAG: MFS transporter [Rhizobiales bacterium]|nr:MFS transporter [Hyphomicrobiales bacterium]